MFLLWLVHLTNHLIETVVGCMSLGIARLETKCII